MKFHDLAIKGTTECLKECVEAMKEIHNKIWKNDEEVYSGLHYLTFEYIGKELPHSKIYISITEECYTQGKLLVNNIIPQEKTELLVDEYNGILECFYDMLKNEIDNLCGCDIIILKNDNFNPLDIMSQTAWNKLYKFSRLANKNNGLSHPMDRDRWNDFICQTLVDNTEILDEDLLNIMCDCDDVALNWEHSRGKELVQDFARIWEVFNYYKHKIELSK